MRMALRSIKHKGQKKRKTSAKAVPGLFFEGGGGSYAVAEGAATA